METTLLHLGIEPYLKYFVYTCPFACAGFVAVIILLIRASRLRAQEADDYFRLWAESMGIHKSGKTSNSWTFQGERSGFRIFVELNTFQNRILIRISRLDGKEMPNASELQELELAGLRTKGDTLTFWVDTKTPDRPDPDIKLLVDRAIDRLQV
jgi:hypothetical protein